MNTEAKPASPGPWVIDENSEGVLGIWGDDDALVCMAPDAGSENVPPGEVVVGNLEKIVRAVNANEELITALKDCLPFVERYCTQNGLNKYIHTKLANDAIAKAEGRQ